MCAPPCKVTGRRYRDRTSGDGELLLFTSGLLRAGGDAHLSLPEAPPHLQLPESVWETPAAAGPAVEPLPPLPDPRPVQVGDRRTVTVRLQKVCRHFERRKSTNFFKISRIYKIFKKSYVHRPRAALKNRQFHSFTKINTRTFPCHNNHQLAPHDGKRKIWLMICGLLTTLRTIRREH